MKQKFMYECEICHYDYATEKSAQNCERAHFEPMHIETNYKDGSPYPKWIEITFVNKNGNSTIKRFWLS